MRAKCQGATFGDRPPAQALSIGCFPGLQGPWMAHVGPGTAPGPTGPCWTPQFSGGVVPGCRSSDSWGEAGLSRGLGALGQSSWVSHPGFQCVDQAGGPGEVWEGGEPPQELREGCPTWPASSGSPSASDLQPEACAIRAHLPKPLCRCKTQSGP